MDEARHYRPDDPHHPGDHERTDVNIPQIAFAGFILVVVAVGIHYALGHLMDDYSNKRASMVGSVRPLSDTLSKASQPSLQVTPADELKTMREDEKSVLDHYTWADRKQGIVRIPIERAMDRLLEQGLPTRETTTQQQGKKRGESKNPKGDDGDRAHSHGH